MIQRVSLKNEDAISRSHALSCRIVKLITPDGSDCFIYLWCPIHAIPTLVQLSITPDAHDRMDVGPELPSHQLNKARVF